VAHLYVRPQNPLATLEHSGGWLTSGSPLDNFAFGFPLWLLEPQLGPVGGTSTSPTTPSPGGQAITSGEEVGYVDFDPVFPSYGGQENPVGVGYYPGPGGLPTGRHVPKTTEVPAVASGLPTYEGPFDGPWHDRDSTEGEIFIPPPPGPVLQDPGQDEAEGRVAVEWYDSVFDIAGQFLQGYQQASQYVPPPTTVGPPAPAQAGSCPTRKTRTLTIDCATGQEIKRPRRRRRRLLTASDLGDLAQLQAMVGKGSNAMSVAVSKAIR